MINSNKIHYKYHKTNTIHKGCFELELSKDAKSSLNPLAFIRIYNEINILEKSLYSILSAIQRGVIRYYDCTDGSEEVIINFCNRFPTFKYPYNIQTSITPPLNTIINYLLIITGLRVLYQRMNGW